MDRIKYCAGRILRAAVTMSIVLSAVFLLLRLLPTEGYFGERTDAISPQVREQVLKELGLRDPWYVQLGAFWSRLFCGGALMSWKSSARRRRFRSVSGWLPC